jgi:hypothetical protein
MARRVSYIPLKRRKPRWYCTNKPHGKVQSLVSYSKTLYYIIDPKEIKAIKRMLGNPSFFDEYDYLLITRDEIGEFNDIFGVTAPTLTNGYKDLAAFTGTVEHVLFGWAPDKRHYDAIMNSDMGGCGTDDSERCDDNTELLDEEVD